MAASNTGTRAGSADGEEWRHHWDLLAEYYDGRSPYGQFFNEKLSYLGIGIHFFL